MEKSIFKILKYFIYAIFVLVCAGLLGPFGLPVGAFIIKLFAPLIEDSMKNRKQRKKLYE